MNSYDPDRAPPPDRWLALDEGERTLLVEDYHWEAGVELPNPRLHAALHVVVENQLALGEEPVASALARLTKQGLSRHDALHAIGSVLAAHLHDLMTADRTPAQEVTRAYSEALGKLSAKSWRASAPGRNDPCPCGSGRKYKRCCMPRGGAAASRAHGANGSGPPPEEDGREREDDWLDEEDWWDDESLGEEDMGPVLEGVLTDIERASLERIFRTKGEAGMDEANAILEEAMLRHNFAPDPALGGLSPDQVARLLYTDWDAEDGAVKLATDLTLSDLAGADILANARIMLRAIEDAEGTDATAAGNLKRRFVAAMLERLRLPEGYLDRVKRYNKVINEEDAFPVHHVRVLLELAGLVKRRKGRFTITARGRKLAADERSGALYARLFRTQFRDMNLAYLDGAEPGGELQHGVAYSLYRFGEVAGDWRSAEELVEPLLLPFVRDSIPVRSEYFEYFDVAALILRTRFLRVLEGFGLAESDRRPTREERVSGTEPLYRKTDLFDRFLVFDLGT